MGTKSLKELYFNFSRRSSTKIVERYRGKYEALSEVLEKNPEVISLAHRDWSRMLSVSSGGRRSGYTSEQMLRALIVMFVEGDSYRQVVVRIENSQFLQHFVGLGPKPMMDYTFLSKAFGRLSEETWQAMNRALSRYARKEDKITGEKLRLDTTVYETNIHYPTDGALLWDSFRTLARILKRVQKEFPELAFPAFGGVSREESEEAVVFHRAQRRQQEQAQKAEGETGVPDADRSSALDRWGGGRNAGCVDVGELPGEGIGALYSVGPPDH